MLVLAALLIGVAARPPAAYVDTATARVPLGITSWCWDTRCGAPLGSSPRRIAVARGAPVHVELKLDATSASVTIGGAPTKATVRGHVLSFTATHSGGLTALVHFRRGWVVYSARLGVT